MIATLTSKGQLTLPKAIRDEMKLEAGSKLDFSVQKDGTLTARPIDGSVSALFGILRRPGMKALTVEEMNEARDAHLVEDDRRIREEAARRHGTAKSRRPARAPRR